MNQNNRIKVQHLGGPLDGIIYQNYNQKPPPLIRIYRAYKYVLQDNDGVLVYNFGGIASKEDIEIGSIISDIDWLWDVATKPKILTSNNQTNILYQQEKKIQIQEQQRKKLQIFIGKFILTFGLFIFAISLFFMLK